jgi:hypothetical protein
MSVSSVPNARIDSVGETAGVQDPRCWTHQKSLVQRFVFAGAKWRKSVNCRWSRDAGYQMNAEHEAPNSAKFGVWRGHRPAAPRVQVWVVFAKPISGEPGHNACPD